MKFEKELLRLLPVLRHSTSEIDHWYSGLGERKLLQEFMDEVQEVSDEFEKEDFEELESELGDVFWCFIQFIAKLDEKGKIDSKKVFSKLYDKIERRCPYLIEGKKVSKEEAVRIWNEAKTAEGYSEDRLWDEEREKEK